MPDRDRPQAHFMPPANWMNDPNGLIQWEGVYHLFYQHNPNAAYWGDMHWGHASSHDLMRWEHLPIALAPDPNGPDASGVWSGCGVNWDGKPTLVYTARNGEKESVCLATSRDGLITWEKHPANPVISAPPEGLDLVGFRDPYVWRDGSMWKMVLGTGIRGVGGAILLYQSPDMLAWEYLGPMITGDRNAAEPVRTGDMWECPNFFRLGDKWVLMISAMDANPNRGLYSLYFTGDFRDNRFTPEMMGKLDGGDQAYYAPQSFRDETGRRIVFGWSRESRSRDAQVSAGWAGVMALPRVLELRAGRGLSIRPVPEVESLRKEKLTFSGLGIQPAGAAPALLNLEEAAGERMELEVDFDLRQPAEDGSFGLLVRRSPGGEEQTEIRVDRLGSRLVVDTLRSSQNAAVTGEEYELPLFLAGLDVLRLRVFLDGSIMEVYANDQAVITARMYPSRENSVGTAVFARQQPVNIRQLTIWRLEQVMIEAGG